MKKILLAFSLCFLTFQANAEETTLIGRVISQKFIENVAACSDLKPSEICMGSWYRWTIKVDRTLDGPPTSGKIIAASIEHGQYVPSSSSKTLVIAPIESDEKRKLLGADYLLLKRE